MPLWILFTTLSVILTLSGVAVTKQWVSNNKSSFFILALILYFLSSLSYMRALKLERITIVEAFWGSAALILTIAMGFLIFNEKVSWQEGIGVIFAILATLLVTVKF